MNTVKGIYSVAYKNPDGQIVVVVQSELTGSYS
ncbi:MAG: glycoside hydrolase family 30 beta sandwich domain-containing protein [Eubacterium sp.]